MTKRKLIKVEMLYEGEGGKMIVSTLEGKQAAEWLEIVNGYVGLQQLRAGRADERLGRIKWQEREVERQ